MAGRDRPPHPLRFPRLAKPDELTASPWLTEQLGALGLVLNCITLWNTVYLDHAVTQLRGDGCPVNGADLARLSPYMRKHIYVHGHYSFTSRAGEGLRSLRDPNPATLAPPRR